MLLSILWPVNTIMVPLLREMLGSELVSTSDHMNILDMIEMRMLIPLRAQTHLRASQGAAWTWCKDPAFASGLHGQLHQGKLEVPLSIHLTPKFWI